MQPRQVLEPGKVRQVGHAVVCEVEGLQVVQRRQRLDVADGVIVEVKVLEIGQLQEGRYVGYAVVPKMQPLQMD